MIEQKRTKMKLLQALVPVDLYSELTTEAEKSGESLSTIVRSMLRDRYEPHGKDGEKAPCAPAQNS